MKVKFLLFTAMIAIPAIANAQNYEKIGICLGIYSYATANTLMSASDLKMGSGVVQKYLNNSLKVWEEKFKPCTDTAQGNDRAKQCLAKLSVKDRDLMIGLMQGISEAQTALPGNQKPNSIMPLANRSCFDAENSIK